ncbi:MAG TPA: AAA family ATPase [Candidatus Binatus sp.]|uniref:AAA family ATPase n=1 Tax=Candidatus Binatus sp. TaxID=2811406 RepID=UPI002B47AA95|nr:AAA family ATPase [Candidatus Binatus sp.]HKN11754.1 AAA family ATPase [Candidatus Binatus sp.]
MSTERMTAEEAEAFYARYKESDEHHEREEASDDAEGLKALDAEELLNLQLSPREFVLAPVIRERDSVMIYSWRGTGKTHLGLAVAYAIASVGKVLRWEAPRPRRVLYVDGEMPATAVQERLANIVKGSEKEPAPGFLKIITPDAQDLPIPNLASPEVQNRFDRLYADSVEVVVFDSISTLFRGGRENEAESWTPAQEWALRLRRKGIAVFFQHHEGKGGAQRGTSRREDTLDTVIHLVRPANYEPAEGARFNVIFEKTRGIMGDAVKPFEAKLEVRDGRAEWTTRDIEDVTLAQAREMFKDGMSVRDVAEELKISKSKAHRLRNKLKDEGDATK